MGDDYYLAGTTMHMMPAVQIMHSKDLVNWELAGYCTDRLDLGPAFRLEGENIYGRGIWAPCIRYHKGMFYVFSNVNGVGLQVFRSPSINGPWERNQLPGRHDLSVLFELAAAEDDADTLAEAETESNRRGRVHRQQPGGSPRCRWPFGHRLRQPLHGAAAFSRVGTGVPGLSLHRGRHARFRGAGAERRGL